ncbi:MAG: hydroxyacylglutathione hydrolase [Cyanobacteria bacterium P01_E01_bin.34]
MDVFRLPVLNDNYVFLLFDPVERVAAAIDPAIAPPVLDKLAALNATLVAIFNTHHHFDHVGGNLKLLSHFPDAVVYGSEIDRDRIPGITVELNDGDRVEFSGETATVYFVPGHTRGHIAYYFPASQHLFCGDTLFSCGCGRLFEGTPAQMLKSLDRLRQLPDDTQVWCAHEYTLKNLKFALTVDPNNSDLQQRYVDVKQARKKNHPTIPTNIAIEKVTNPFFRWDSPALQAATNISDPVRVFARLRGKRDRF